MNALLEPSFIILDVGCGRGAYQDDPIILRKNLRTMKGKTRKVIGIDVDETAKKNHFLDVFHLTDGKCWPLDDESVDLILCDNVLERVADPDNFFSEIHRILKHQGYLCIRTPNSWGYVGILSRLIPNQYHVSVLKGVQKNIEEENVFSTYYRCNSIPQLRLMLNKYYFKHSVYCYEAEPSYMSFSKFFYWVSVLHQRFAPSFLKLAIFAFGRKSNIGT